MPALHLADQTNKLRIYYQNLNNFQKFFFPRELAALLEQDPPASAVQITHAAFKNTWFFHKLLFTGLNDFFKSNIIISAAWLFDPQSIPKSAEHEIKQTDALNTKISAKAKTAVQKLRDYYNGLHPFAQAFFPNALRHAIVNTHSDVHVIQAAFRSSWVMRWLYPKKFRNFFNNEDIQNAHQIILEHTLPHGAKRVQRNVDALHYFSVRNGIPDDGVYDGDTIASILCALSQPLENRPTDNLTAQRRLDTLRTHDASSIVVTVLLLLNQAGTFSNITDKTLNAAISSFNDVITGLHSTHAETVLSLLDDVGLLRGSKAPDNVLSLLKLRTLGHVESLLVLLQGIELFTSDNLPQAQANFEAIIKHPKREALLRALEMLQQENMLNDPIQTQQQFEALVKRENPDAEAQKWINRRMPPRRGMRESATYARQASTTPTNNNQSIMSSALVVGGNVAPTATPSSAASGISIESIASFLSGTWNNLYNWLHTAIVTVTAPAAQAPQPNVQTAQPNIQELSTTPHVLESLIIYRPIPMAWHAIRANFPAQFTQGTWNYVDNVISKIKREATLPTSRYSPLPSSPIRLSTHIPSLFFSSTWKAMRLANAQTQANTSLLDIEQGPEIIPRPQHEPLVETEGEQLEDQAEEGMMAVHAIAQTLAWGSTKASDTYNTWFTLNSWRNYFTTNPAATESVSSTIHQPPTLDVNTLAPPPTTGYWRDRAVARPNVATNIAEEGANEEGQRSPPVSPRH
jgi:hypothetical protein